MTFKRSVPVLSLLLMMPWMGCLGGKPLRAPAPPPQEQVPPREDLAPHLLGSWENTDKGGKTRQMVFESGGQLTFKGGLEFYNPGQWELDAQRHELRITLPQADVDKLQVFQLYLHGGVKAFDPARKQITYSFDNQTWTLNVAGWDYSKVSKPAIQNETEPVLK